MLRPWDVSVSRALRSVGSALRPQKLFDPAKGADNIGAIVDGFPRTAKQAGGHYLTPSDAISDRRPSHICVPAIDQISHYTYKTGKPDQHLTDIQCSSSLLSPQSAPFQPFPAAQVDFLRLLHAQLKELHLRYADHPVLRNSFPRPLFVVVVLYVDEEESVHRQMARGQRAARDRDAGILEEAGGVPEIRTTDTDEATARRRFQARIQGADSCPDKALGPLGGPRLGLWPLVCCLPRS